MKLYSKGGKFATKGGKFAADSKQIDKKNTAAASAPKVRIPPAAMPDPEVRTPPVAMPAPEVRSARREDILREVRRDAAVRPVSKAVPAASANSAARAKTAPNSRGNNKSRKRNKRRRIFLTAFLIFFLIIASTLLFLAARKYKAANDFRQLAEQIQANAEAEAAEPPETEYIEPTESIPDETEPEQAEETEETEPPVKTILPKYAELYQANTEFFGWVRVDDTVLDYPVMRSHEDNEKYLYANFDGAYSYAGTPFADIKCSHDSDNIMIYGHNIKDGSMFSSLFKYEEESFWREHPTIMFSDLYEDYEYEVLAAFYDRVYLKSDTCFKFYQFIDAEDEADFDYAISQFKEKALYDTGVDAEYGDKLITLVTCAYHVENGRFVVVARRK